MATVNLAPSSRSKGIYASLWYSCPEFNSKAIKSIPSCTRLLIVSCCWVVLSPKIHVAARNAPTNAGIRREAIAIPISLIKPSGGAGICNSGSFDHSSHLTNDSAASWAISMSLDVRPIRKDLTISSKRLVSVPIRLAVSKCAGICCLLSSWHLLSSFSATVDGSEISCTRNGSPPRAWRIGSVRPRSTMGIPWCKRRRYIGPLGRIDRLPFGCRRSEEMSS